MKKFLFIFTVIVVVLLGYRFYISSRNVSQETVTNNDKVNSNYSLTVADLVEFFNTKFSCLGSEVAATKDCFTKNFESVNVQGIYDNPVFTFTDFTGDGYEDALVTIYYSGSGAFRDFYALTKDVAVAGESVAGVRIAYQKSGEGFSRDKANWSNGNGGYNLFCPDQNKDTKPDCNFTIYWDQNLKTFVKEQDKNKTGTWKQYENKQVGFKFSYPKKLTLNESPTKVTLSHSIPFKNSGCDMKGDGEVYNTLTDFTMSFEFKPKLRPSYVDGQYTAGSLSGPWAWEGVEGCGSFKYYFPVFGDQTLLVTKELPQALSGVIALDVQKEVLKVPGVISKDESEQIFKHILQTFSFVK